MRISRKREGTGLPRLIVAALRSESTAWEPVQTLVGELERIVSALPDAVLFPGLGADGQRRFAAAMGVPPPPGLTTFLAAHDGGLLAPDTRLLTLDEAAARVAGGARTFGSARWQVGLWPVAERAGRRYALDAEEASGDGEWPVVEVTEHGLDRVGTSFLRFLHVLCAELAAGSASGDAAISLAETRCWRDPGHADHWLDMAELLEAAGRTAEIDATLEAALRAATPATPALMLAIGMRSVRAGDNEGALRAFKDAIALEPVGARDYDARLDAAALVFVLAAERGDAPTAAAARALLENRRRRPPRSGGVRRWARWRGGTATSRCRRSARSRCASSRCSSRTIATCRSCRRQSRDLRAGLRRLKEGRDALEAGQAEAAVRAVRAALATPGTWRIWARRRPFSRSR